MKRHEKKSPQKVVTEKMEYHSTVDEAAVENSIVSESNEYKRKLEMEREVKQTNDIEPDVWRPWQEDSEALELFEKLLNTE